MWRPQLERVPEGWRFIAPHFRGFGRSLPPKGGRYTINYMNQSDRHEKSTLRRRRVLPDGRLELDDAG